MTPAKLIAQVLIFGLVYFVLNRYAFGPILAMLEARRKRIADGEAKLEKIARDLAAAEENARAHHRQGQCRSQPPHQGSG